MVCSPSVTYCSSVGSSLHRATGPARNLLQRGLPTGSQPPFGIHLLRRGILHGLQVDISSTVDLHGLQGDSLPHQGLHHRLQGNLCSSTWSISSLSFFTDLGVCRVGSLTCSHSSLQLLFLCHSNSFFPFLKMLSQRRYLFCWLARPWPTAGPSWSRLALALSDMGEASSKQFTFVALIIDYWYLAVEILTARQKKAEELKRLTDLASHMAEAQLSELRAEIKHFVSERKYDEELGRSARFSCDTEQLKTQIQLCGEISHPKNNYSSRTPCNSVLSSMTSHATTGKQNTHTRKSSSNAKNSENKTASTKVQSNLSSNPTESSSQGTLTNKQNGPSSQRRRFNPQHQNIRLNGSLKSQGASNEADQNNVKSGSRSEHRRQQHNSFRSKNKGAMKNQEQSTTTRTTENPTHSEKTRRKHHTPDTADHRPFQGNVGRVSQCNLCPARMEVSADATVLSVPAVTLVA
uniref:SPATS2-like protein n=1 Tax=Accipiter nisus TaxID=211598 RepID=A0A8B9MTF9_9AVES